METETADAIIRFATTVQETLQSVGRLIESTVARMDAELAEIRDGMIELDHAKAQRRDLESLHSRVDALEGR